MIVMSLFDLAIEGGSSCRRKRRTRRGSSPPGCWPGCRPRPWRRRGRVRGLLDQPEMAIRRVDDLVAAGVHPSIDRGPREVGLEDARVVGVGRVEHGRERSIRELELPIDDVDRDPVRRAVVSDQRAVVGVRDRQVTCGAIVVRAPVVAVQLTVDDRVSPKNALESSRPFTRPSALQVRASLMMAGPNVPLKAFAGDGGVPGPQPARPRG